MDPLKISPDWYGAPAVVAASGPSLTSEVIQRCRYARWVHGWRVLAVNDAYKAMPWADALYAADLSWWQVHEGAKGFDGQRFALGECKELLAKYPKIRLIGGCAGADFSTDRTTVHFGEPEHSGFQAINLAILLGAKRIVLAGFDYRVVEGKAHFFGDHPTTLRQHGDENFRQMTKAFDDVHSPVPIVNATPGSRLKKFPMVSLDEELPWDRGLSRDRPEPDAAAG